MKKSFISVLLSCALVFSSLTVPVFAEEVAEPEAVVEEVAEETAVEEAVVEEAAEEEAPEVVENNSVSMGAAPVSAKITGTEDLYMVGSKKIKIKLATEVSVRPTDYDETYTIALKKSQYTVSYSFIDAGVTAAQVEAAGITIDSAKGVISISKNCALTGTVAVKCDVKVKETGATTSDTAAFDLVNKAVSFDKVVLNFAGGTTVSTNKKKETFTISVDQIANYAGYEVLSANGVDVSSYVKISGKESKNSYTFTVKDANGKNAKSIVLKYDMPKVKLDAMPVGDPSTGWIEAGVADTLSMNDIYTFVENGNILNATNNEIVPIEYVKVSAKGAKITKVGNNYFYNPTAATGTITLKCGKNKTVYKVNNTRYTNAKKAKFDAKTTKIELGSVSTDVVSINGVKFAKGSKVSANAVTYFNTDIDQLDYQKAGAKAYKDKKFAEKARKQYNGYLALDAIIGDGALCGTVSANDNMLVGTSYTLDSYYQTGLHMLNPDTLNDCAPLVDGVYKMNIYLYDENDDLAAFPVPVKVRVKKAE